MSGSPIGINPAAAVAKHNAAANPHAFTPAGLALARATDLAAQKTILGITAGGSGGFQGNLDCSTNPNFPAANAGDFYCVSVAGKIGGANGIDVLAGALILCRITAAAGDNATVGANWDLLPGELGGPSDSPFAATWTQRTAPTTNSLLGICATPSGFVVVGNGTVAITSSDNSTWNAQTVPDLWWIDLAHGNGITVAVANSGGTANAMRSTDDGATWTQASGTLANLSAICFGAGLFVAVAEGIGSNCIMTSPTGEVWTIRAAFDAYWKDLCWDGTYFIAVAEEGVMRSTDAINWNFIAAPSDYWDGVCAAGGLIVAVADDATIGQGIMTSSDHGATWTVQSKPIAQSLNAILHNGNHFVTVGNGDFAITSPDAITWTESAMNVAPGTWSAIAINAGVLAAVRGGGGTDNQSIATATETTAPSEYVTGPQTATQGNLAIFADATGKVIADGGAIPDLAAHTASSTGPHGITAAGAAIVTAADAAAQRTALDVPGLNTANTLTGTQKVQVAAGKDAIALEGGSGGTSGFTATIRPLALSASRDLSLPDENGTIATRGAQTFSGKQVIDLGSGTGGILNGSFLCFVGANGGTISMSSESYGSGNGTIYSYYNIGGTREEKSATQAGSGFVTHLCRGHDGNVTTGTKGSFGASAVTAWSGSSTPLFWYWNGCKTGSTTSERFMTLQEGNLEIPSGTVTASGFKVGTNQIIGPRGAAVANATDAASVIARLNELLAICRTHGLIAQ